MTTPRAIRFGAKRAWAKKVTVENEVRFGRPRSEHESTIQLLMYEWIMRVDPGGILEIEFIRTLARRTQYPQFSKALLDLLEKDTTNLPSSLMDTHRKECDRYRQLIVDKMREGYVSPIQAYEAYYRETDCVM
jgi:hypothetical protein